MSVTLYTPDLSKIIHETKVDFRQRVIQPIIHIVQYDKSLPIIAVKLYNNGIAYALPENADVSVRWGKRDHTFVYNAVLGCNSDRTIVYFEITEQMTVFYGEHNPIIELRNGTSLAGSGYIQFYLDRNPIQDGDVESYVESSIIDDLNNAVTLAYSDLKTLRDMSKLVPGQQYRITDYITTTAQADTKSAGHAFDLIVIADDINKLNENARAIIHSGDTYFANSKLESWEIKYCLDNDTSRFAWADTVNGKGVIYFMKDEFNNECHYDFKNIQYLVNATYVYTFGGINDDTLRGNSFNNKIGMYLEPSTLKLELPINTFGTNCNSNTFGTSCYANTFGNNCNSNTFGNYCYSNTFGNNCYSNTFGNNCKSNTFGNACSSTTFGYYCNSNTIGTNCYSNTFGNDCNSNTFGNYCRLNTFGNYCSSNTFGDRCNSNTFGNDCNYNTFGNYCYYDTFENDCDYLQISNNAVTQKKYIHVDNGIQGASSVNKFDLYDAAILNKDYQVTFKKSASGKYLMLWADDIGDTNGKYKNNNLDNSWKIIPQEIEGGTF